MGALEINKELFFQLFQTFWDCTFRNEKLAILAFKKVGLIPFDPFIAYDKLQLFQA